MTAARLAAIMANTVNAIIYNKQQIIFITDWQKHRSASVNKVATRFFHIRRLKQIRRLLRPEVTATLISAFILSRLNYCNAVFADLPKVTIAPLQRAQNAATRLILRLAPDDHVAFRHLHWLPVQYRITYKLYLLMHLIHIHKAPSNLENTVTPTASVSSRGRLRSANSSRNDQPRMLTKFESHPSMTLSDSNISTIRSVARPLFDSWAFCCSTVWVKFFYTPEVFLNFFPNGWELLIIILYACYSFILTLNCKILFNYCDKYGRQA